MELTKSEAIANHRKMWNWIADETLKRKRTVRKWDYFRAHEISGLDIPRHQCYCCEYTSNGVYLNCRNCPIVWGGEINTCMDRDNFDDDKELYSLWCDEPDYIKSAELARRIAELPERK